jgi:phosphoribosyl 1,2-cyclic phosphodiesterase
MAIAYCVLASGSRGNSVWLRGGGVEILVDCGLSAKQIEQRLAAVGRSATELRAIVCSHSHHDHVAGAAVLSRRYDLDIYATASTLRRIPGGPPAQHLHKLPTSGAVQIDGLEVRTTPTPHDATGSVALRFDDSDTRVGVITDLGKPTAAIERTMAGAHGLILECNHDLEMLRDGPYPAVLKQRIRSDVGHLSNEQGAEFLTRLLHAGLQHLTLAHLSETNNRPEMAAESVTSVLSRIGASGLDVAVAEQHRPGEPVELAPGRGVAAGVSRCTPECAGPPSSRDQLSLPYRKD